MYCVLVLSDKYEPYFERMILEGRLVGLLVGGTICPNLSGSNNVSAVSFFPRKFLSETGHLMCYIDLGTWEMDIMYIARLKETRVYSGGTACSFPPSLLCLPTASFGYDGPPILSPLTNPSLSYFLIASTFCH